jgi:hypothetical protein
VNLALLLVLHAAACPSDAPVANAPGLSAVANLPAADAMRENGEGKQLYRQERWREARGRYQAALAADPSMLAAALNIACSYSRQGLYDEAANEAAKLIRQAYVPWNREVEEAADLGILPAQPAFAKIVTARAEAAPAYGKQVREGILFVARTRPPVNVVGEGVLVLSLNQEIFAWIPETGRYFQVTAEDGHVLAFAVSADGRRIAYLIGSKLVRPAGQAGALRGLSLRVLDLVDMSLGPALPIPGDATKVQLWFGAQPELKVTDVSGATALLRRMPAGLETVPRLASGPRAASVLLSSSGVEPAFRLIKRDPCIFSLSTQRDSAGRWRLQVTPPKGKPFSLDTRYGAGLQGMAFPQGAPLFHAKEPPPRKE